MTGIKMEPLLNRTNSFECLWVKITTENSIFYVATIYHPPDHMYDPDDLVEFLTVVYYIKYWGLEKHVDSIV